MAIPDVIGTPVVASNHERPELTELDALFHDHENRLNLVDQHGETVPLSETATQLFHEVAHALAEGRPVAVRVLPTEVTVQQAADLLDVPASSVVALVEHGEISTVVDGAHRIRFQDVLAYKERRDAARREGLAELTRLSQEMGLYNTVNGSDEMPPIDENFADEDHAE